MSSPEIDWLTAREQVDSRFRSRELAAKFATATRSSSLIVDLGCGTGGNMRFLSDYFAKHPSWLGIDHDANALSIAADRLCSKRHRFQQANLATQLSCVPQDDATAITASAFLDLTSRHWIERFATHCDGMPILIAMTAGGQPMWEPIHKADVAIQKVLRTHQASDHGFGPAMGDEAAPFLAEQLRLRGREVTLAETDWRIDAKDHPIVAMMIHGIARRVDGLGDSADIADWKTARLAQLDSNRLSLTIRHYDLLSCV